MGCLSWPSIVATSRQKARSLQTLKSYSPSRQYCYISTGNTMSPTASPEYRNRPVRRSRKSAPAFVAPSFSASDWDCAARTFAALPADPFARPYAQNAADCRRDDRQNQANAQADRYALRARKLRYGHDAQARRPASRRAIWKFAASTASEGAFAMSTHEKSSDLRHAGDAEHDHIGDELACPSPLPKALFETMVGRPRRSPADPRALRCKRSRDAYRQRLIRLRRKAF